MRVTTAVPNRFWLKSSQVVRWRMRGLLKALPERSRQAAGAGGPRPTVQSHPRIAYLFAGTYGDFVQVLRPLNRLAAAYPDSEIILFGADRYAREFAAELPANLRIAQAFEPFRWFLEPVDLLLTNCVGVYRVRFDFAARFCARRAFGFRHSHETRRGGYAATLALSPQVRSFAEENLKVLDLAGVPSASESAEEDPGATASRPATRAGDGVPAWGKGKILFHIGSAGLKKDFGLKIYTRLVFGILDKLKDRQVEVVMGPGDEDIAQEVRGGTGFVPQMFPLSRLISILRSFEGTVVCFNSFPAHICHYLERPAIVIHRKAVPFGYDCAPLHKQVVLDADKDWALDEVLEILEAGTPPVAD
jgi:ADP-heptose:LPS heptosyltransferase